MTPAFGGGFLLASGKYLWQVGAHRWLHKLTAGQATLAHTQVNELVEPINCTTASGSGLKMRVNNNVVTDKRPRNIKGLSRTGEGKKHDKKRADEQDLNFPPDSKWWKDTGFQGYEPANTPTFQPKRKPKGGELTPEEKAQTTTISSERIGGEHSIGGGKVFRITQHIFRPIKQGCDDLVMETACGLHNLRIDHPMRA